MEEITKMPIDYELMRFISDNGNSAMYKDGCHYIVLDYSLPKERYTFLEYTFIPIDSMFMGLFNNRNALNSSAAWKEQVTSAKRYKMKYEMVSGITLMSKS